MKSCLWASNGVQEGYNPEPYSTVLTLAIVKKNYGDSTLTAIIPKICMIEPYGPNKVLILVMKPKSIN
jgi:hypothetical protein